MNMDKYFMWIHYERLHNHKKAKHNKTVCIFLGIYCTLGCLDQYVAQNSKYARPPIPSQPPTQKVFFQWHTKYDPIMKHSHCETVYAQELFQWLFFELVHSLQIL